MNILKQLKLIEQSTIGHFVFLPKALGFNIHRFNGVTIINCGFESSMFNIAYGAPANPNISAIITRTKDVFKGRPFAWWIPPTEHNPGFTKALLESGLILETTEHAMICGLTNIASFEQKTYLSIKPVVNSLLLQDFISVIEPYDNSTRGFYEMIKSEQLQLQEKLFIGYVDNNPVTIGILFISDATAGIFSLITKKEDQGKGYGTDMMRFLLSKAKMSNCRYATLSASSDSGYRIYERLRFNKIGKFECFECKG